MTSAEAANWFGGSVALVIGIAGFYWTVVRSKVLLHTEPGSWYSGGDSCCLVMDNRGATAAHVSRITAIWPPGAALSLEKRAANTGEPWLPGKVLPLKPIMHLDVDITILPGAAERIEFYFLSPRSRASSARISVSIDESRMTQISKTRLVMVTKKAVSQAK